MIETQDPAAPAATPAAQLLIKPELTTSELCELLGFTVSVPFLCERLGVIPVRQEKAAKFWARTQVPEIVAKLQGFLTNYVLKGYEGFVPTPKEPKAKEPKAKKTEAAAPAAAAPAVESPTPPAEVAQPIVTPVAPAVDFFGNPIGAATPEPAPAPVPLSFI